MVNRVVYKYIMVHSIPHLIRVCPTSVQRIKVALIEIKADRHIMVAFVTVVPFCCPIEDHKLLRF